MPASCRRRVCPAVIAAAARPRWWRTSSAKAFRWRCSKRAKEQDWEISFRFAGSPNVTNLTIGTITGINKKGWEYLWVRYQDAEDSDAKQLVKIPIQVNVEKVYELGDFALLGIG